MHATKVMPVAQDSASFQETYLESLGKAVERVFQVQCQRPIQQSEVRAYQSGDCSRIEIAAVMSIIDRDITGTVALCFDRAAFLAVMSDMMGEECDEIDDELEDGVGELLNIIFGAAKEPLNNAGFAIEKALPTIMRGKSLARRGSLTPGETTLLAYESNGFQFFMQVGFDE